MEKLGVDAPDWEELGAKGTKVEDLPPHIKNLAGLNYSELKKLEMKEETRRELLESWKHLFDERIYENVKASEAKPSKVNKILMQRLGDIEYIVPLREEYKGGVRVFLVPEWSKFRARVIKHTFDVNDYIKAPEVQLPTPMTVEEAVKGARFAGAIDFSAYFDQFKLGDKVQKYFCVLHNHKRYALTRMPMGMRSAVAVAQATSKAIADIKTDCCILVYIDNIYVLGKTRKEVEEALKEIAERANKAGIIVNELVDPLSKDSDEITLRHVKEDERSTIVKNLVTDREIEILGRIYNLRSKTVRLGPKTLGKLKAVRDALTDKTFWEGKNRWFASMMGLLAYASGTLRIKAAQHAILFRTLLSIQRTALWDQLITIDEGHVRHLRIWLDEALANRQRSLKQGRGRSSGSPVLMVDASGGGWGGVYYYGGVITTACGEWEDDEKVRCQQSVVSEPEGFLKAVERLVPPTRRRVIVGTDSVKVAGSIRHADTNPDIYAERLANLRPFTDFVVFHVQGCINPGDASSRGQETDVQLAMQVGDALYKMDMNSTGHGTRLRKLRGDDL